MVISTLIIELTTLFQASLMKKNMQIKYNVSPLFYKRNQCLKNSTAGLLIDVISWQFNLSEAVAGVSI